MLCRPQADGEKQGKNALYMMLRRTKLAEQPYQSLVAVIIVALASMMLVVIAGAFIQTKHTVPCSAHLMDRAGIYHELLLACEVSDFGVK